MEQFRNNLGYLRSRWNFRIFPGLPLQATLYDDEKKQILGDYFSIQPGDNLSKVKRVSGFHILSNNQARLLCDSFLLVASSDPMHNNR